MPLPHRPAGVGRALAVSACLCWRLSADAAPVISEIMYRPGSTFPENTAAEYLEIYNPDGEPADIGGWAITEGVSYTFPEGTVIPAGGYVTVAANPETVQNQHGVTGVLGPWTGTLSNNGETVTLSEPDGAGGWREVNSVRYASEGDWADRVVEPFFGGLAWSTPAESGRSLELRNPALPNTSGQNWAPSTAASGGTPGAANTALTEDIPPVISEVTHSPAVPRPGQPVTVSCRIEDENGAESVAAVLFWRTANTNAQMPWERVPMDRAPGGDIFSAVMPPQTNGGIHEFYVSAADGALTRLWPAPTSAGQNANCLVQTTSEAPSADTSMHRLVLTAADNAAFNSMSSQSDRQFNQTLVVTRGGQSDIRYRSSMRIRGNSSRGYMFRPLRVNIPNDAPLDGVRAFNLAPRSSWGQFLGMRLFEAAGLRATTAVPVELRRNGAEQATSTGNTPDFGKWARVEELNGDFTDRAWRDASGGGLYKKGRPDQYWRATAQTPVNPDLLLDGWSKQSNSAANDWSDLTSFFQRWQANAAPHFPTASPLNTAGANGSQTQGTGAWAGTSFTAAQMESLSTVADLDQWARWLALMTVIQSNETNISNGQDDDYAMYFVPGADGNRRAQLLPHDLDTILGQGDQPLQPNARGLYDMTAESSVFRPLLPLAGNGQTAGNAEFTLKYRTALRELLGGLFYTTDEADPTQPFNLLLENLLGNWATPARRATLRSFIRARRAHLLTLLGEDSLPPAAPTASATLTAPPSGPLRLSEALVNGGGALGWVELHNSGSAALPLDGTGLTDTTTIPHRFVFPPGTVLEPGERLTVSLDESATGAGFTSDHRGGSLFLTSPDGDPIDSVTFGPQAAGLSIARTGEAEDTWALCSPTPAQPNGAPVPTAGPEGVRINEWLADPDFRLRGDFVELRNDAALPAAVGGVAVTDDPMNAPRKFVFPALSFLAPGGLTVLREEDGGEAAALPFGLNALSDYLEVLGENGARIDRAVIVNQMPGVATGVPADGGPSLFSPRAVPTPGLSNNVPERILALANGLRITEILFRPLGQGETENEFVELQNMGAVPLDLNGVRFTRGISYTFTGETILQPAEIIVLCRDRARFLARWRDPAIRLAPGVFEGGLGNTGETLALTLPAPFDANILSFAYDPAWEPDAESAGYSLVTTATPLTPPADWRERASWTRSPIPGGNPGRDTAPTLLTQALPGTIIGDLYDFTLTTDRPAGLFTVTGLPAGLTVNAATGRISGFPQEYGSFPLTASAGNTGGTGAPVSLTLNVAASGPLDHYSWDVTPARAQSGVPFPVRLTARDARDRPALSHSAPLTLSVTVGGHTGPRLVISEAFDQDPDQFEITNVTADSVNTAGWFCVVNDAGQGSSDINETPTVGGNPAWTLPGRIDGGRVFRVSESPDTASPPSTYTFWENIPWGHTNRRRGWILLANATGQIEDFVAWGVPLEDGTSERMGLSDLSLTVNVGGAPVLLQPLAAGAWTGEPDAHIATAGFSYQRGGARDTNSSADWSWRANSVQNGPARNAGLALPWVTPGPLIVSPPAGEITGGSFTAMVTIRGVSEDARLVALPGGTSHPFPVEAGPADTDGDSLPDEWETANGFDPQNPDDANGDADGDGYSNLVEHRAGTDPRDAESRLRLTDWTAAGNLLSFTWQAVEGRVYRLSASADLESWTVVPESVTIADEGGPASAQIRPAGAKAFYRLELVY